MSSAAPPKGPLAESSDVSVTLAEASVIAAWVGIAAGWAQVAVLAIIKYGGLALPPEGWVAASFEWRHGFLWLSPHVVWMAPVVLVGIFWGVGVSLLAAGRRWPRFGRAQTVAGSMVFLTIVNLLWTYPRLYDWAVVLFAAGVAVQTARSIGRRYATVRRVANRTVPLMIGAVVISAFGIIGWETIVERRARDALPSPSADRPNVLLVILDTVRATNLSVYGYDRPTSPNLEDLATRGIVFDRANATSPWTLPSHVSLFTGRLPYEVSASWLSPYEGEFDTLAEYLSGHGYLTAGFVANVVYAGYESGVQRGFVHYEDYRLTAGELLVSTPLSRKIANNRLVRRLVGFHDVIDRKSAEEITADFLDWHSGIDDDRPYFAFLNYLDAHEPYLPPAPYDTMFGPLDIRNIENHGHQHRLTVRPNRQAMSPAQIQGEVDAYDGALAFVDAQIGRLLKELERRGGLANTLVIVTSDHGEQFGEHGLHLHGNSLYMPNLHVPMIVTFEGRVPAGQSVAAPVSIRDIPATVASLAGLSRGNSFPGASLERYWSETNLDQTDAASDVVFAELTDIRGAPKWKSVLVGPYHYIWGEDQREELYDLQRDPAEEQNVIVDANRAGLLTRLRRLLAPHVRNDRVLWERLPATADDIRRR